MPSDRQPTDNAVNVRPKNGIHEAGLLTLLHTTSILG